MNSNKVLSLRRLFSIAFLVVAAMMFSGLAAKANPYASGITNDNGTIRFYLNEAGGDVTVIYDDGTTNANFDPVNLLTGLNQSVGQKSFALGLHDGYKIIVNKLGNGTPVQISTDNAANTATAPFTWWPTGRGVETYKSAKVGWLFGRVYVGNDANSAFRQYGISVLTPDLNQIIKVGAYTTNLPGGQFVGAFAADAFFGNTSTPWRLRFGKDDNNLYAACNGTSGGTVLQFGPDFEYTNIVLGPFGENQGIVAATHADPQGVFVTGTLAGGNLKVWTMDPALSAPAVTSFTDPYPPAVNNIHPTLGGGGPMGVGAYGPTIDGDYNMLLRYDVGSGDATHYNVVNVWTNNGGTGYLVNDIVTNVGGVCATSNHINRGFTNATYQVTAIGAGGSISIVQVVTPGDYTTAPVGPVSVTGGAGSGATLNIWAPQVLWSGKPNFATGLGLGGFPDSQIGDVALGSDGKIFGTFRRFNYSDGSLQGFEASGATRIYDSLKIVLVLDTFGGIATGSDSSYGGVAFSPDGKYVATMGTLNDLTVALLTNGVPDDATIFIITNAPNVGNGRGLAWDAADNLYAISSGQAELRVYSLGNTSTCISSNDSSGVNGTFQLILPAVTASLSVPVATASQNYINSAPPGTPIPGSFRVSLNVPTLASPVTINFTLTGTAIQGTHYNINTGTDGNGVTVAAGSVTFPAATAPSGNWFKDITITPTATPLFTNTLTAQMLIVPSANYLRAAPVKGNVNILNTGPQVLILTPGTGYTTMYRGTTNDYAQFVLTRLGDLSGPGLAGHGPQGYTVTNFDLLGTSVPPTNGAVNPDFTAGPQVWNPVGTPSDSVGGNFSINIPAGIAVITNVVGNPVYRGDIYTPPVNASIVLSITNKVLPTGTDFTAVTNSLSQEGFPYAVFLGNSATLTILDNRLGPEVVLYSNPLTNAADASNWTLTWDGTNINQGPITNALPFVMSPYVNNTPYDGVHDYNVSFGYDRTTEPAGAIPASPIMTASNWNNVLRMTVNKNINVPAPSGVNLYPNQTFGGNYALRFNMYLSTYANSIGNPFVGSLNREFAMFGMNHYGTNCNWRIASPINNRAINAGNDRTNQDGIWFTIDAGTGSQTPADFDGFQGGPIPNQGWRVSDTVSSLASIFKGVFKSPPFPAEITYDVDPNNVGGQPVNNWVDVSMEINNQTNCTLIMNKTKIFSMLITNGYTSGELMLGYLDPVKSQGDPNSEWVYYSNVRAVELSPFISVQAQVPGTALGATNYFMVAQGSSLTFTSSATFATAPITNKWFRGTGAFSNAIPGAPTVLLQSGTAGATPFNDSFTKTFSVLADATNYMNVYSDAAGSVTSRVAGVEVIFGGTTNSNFGTGDTRAIVTTAAGPSAPNQFQWWSNSVADFSTAVKVTASTHFGTPTSATLWITNVTAADAGYYFLAATNSNAFVANSSRFAIVTNHVIVGNDPSGLTVTPTPQTDPWGSNATFTVSVGAGDLPLTYVWKKGATVLANNTHIGGATSSQLTISNITAGDAATYTAAVTNAFGGATATGVLIETTPAPRIISVGADGVNITVSFTTTNGFDNTSTFTLQAAGAVSDAPPTVWTNVTGTSFTTSGGGNFQVTSPQNPGAPTLFYRVIHN